jgi:uncharacterized protein (DUF3820 family)
MAELVFNFGKYRGKRPDEVPSEYLRWVIDQDWFNDKFTDLSNECVSELEFREKY